MNLAKVWSRAGTGLSAPKVAIETHISSGLPIFVIVGLPEAAVRESKERVRSSIINANFKFPSGRITIALAPANLPKSGSRYDLPIALSILLASGQITTEKDLSDFEFYGELGLDGLLNVIDGLFPAVLQASKQNTSVIVPVDSDNKLAIIENCNILTASHLLEVCGFLTAKNTLPELIYKQPKNKNKIKNLAEVRGQFFGKRALEIAASGGHNLLFSGTPGSGKTMLAERITSIMPAIKFDEILEVIAIYSVANKNFVIGDNRPFRAPHHLSSSVALIGGGANPKPGEISLAHNGVLFLDELPEFSRNVLEVLRQPLESGSINISRAKDSVNYPANFQLIAAMNPCPCGYFGDGTTKCHCTFEQVAKYKHKISGPLLDRIDMRIHIKALPSKDLLSDKNLAENSETIAKRVKKVYDIQINRQNKVNAKLDSQELSNVIRLSKEQKQLLATAIEKLNLSARAYHKVLKVGRTIADMDNLSNIETKHLVEALSYQR